MIKEDLGEYSLRGDESAARQTRAEAFGTFVRALRASSGLRGHRPKVVALVPAHNEEELLPEAIRSLLAQSRRPDRVIVVADNCTDSTVSRAKEFGSPVQVVETVDNRHMKAGALNQALCRLLPTCLDNDAVLVMDGDSTIAPRFIEKALESMKEADVGAVGGIFHAVRTSNLVERLQAAEYTRYARDIARGKAKAKVITGTGALFRASSLKSVRQARQAGRLPGTSYVYDTASLTEDNELTLALKHLGWRCISPKQCVVHTDVMPTWKNFWQQRMRWQRGAIENLRAYGWNRVTVPYIARQAFMYLGILAIALLITITLMSAALGTLELQLFWALVTTVFLAERVVTVRRLGWGAVLLASVLVIEMLYDLIQQAVYIRAGLNAVFRRDERWGTHNIRSVE